MECTIDFVCKIGGSVLSEKEKYETLCLTSLTKVSVVLQKAYALQKSFIIIHGAGLGFNVVAMDHVFTYRDFLPNTCIRKSLSVLDHSATSMPKNMVWPPAVSQIFRVLSFVLALLLQDNLS